MCINGYEMHVDQDRQLPDSWGHGDEHHSSIVIG